MSMSEDEIFWKGEADRLRALNAQLENEVERQKSLLHDAIWHGTKETISCNKADAKVDHLEKLKAQLLEALKEVQWRGDDGDGYGGVCPECGGGKPGLWHPDDCGHSRNCKVGTAIALAEKELE